MLNKNEFLWNFEVKTKHRAGVEEANELLIAAIYKYCDEKGMEVDDDTELLNYADELLSKMPIDLYQFEISEFLDSCSDEEIKDFTAEILEKNNLREGSTTKELSKLICNLLNLEDGDSIFDLGSGRGRFLINAAEFTEKRGIRLSELNGAEINYRLWLISRMALSIIFPQTYKTKETTTKSITLQDCLTQTIKQKYTKGYTFAPLAAKLIGGNENIPTMFGGEFFTSRNSVEWVFIDKLLKNICGNANFRAVSLVSGRALFNYADKFYIDLLMKKGLIEGIIELPRGILDDTQISTFLIVFSSGNKNVRFLDSSDFFNYELVKKPEEAVFADQIYNEYLNRATIKITEDLIGLQNYTPSLVLLNVKKPKDGAKLGDIAEVFSGSQYTIKRFTDSFSDEDTGYKILTSSDIDGSFVDWKKLKSIVCEDKKLLKFALQKNDLVFTSKSSKVKILVVDQELSHKVIVTGGMLIIRPDVSSIIPTFLKIYFESEDGQIALRKIQKGLTIITINAVDLKSIIVPVPALEYQKRVSAKYINKISTLKVLKNEIKNLEDEIKNFYSSEELMDEH